MRLRRSPDVRLQIVLALEVEAPWWPTSCTAGDTQAYVHCMRDLVDIHYPDARSSGSSKIIYRPIPPAPCIRRSRQLTPGGFCDGSSSTTPPNTQAGSTWSRSRSASCRASAWIAELTIPSDCVAKSPPGNGSGMRPTPASNGCSQQTRPAFAPKRTADDVERCPLLDEQQKTFAR
jgi:hypothetical protein